MNLAAAWSSSAVVTPGRHFDRSIRRHRAWIAPAIAICSICSGVLTMIPPRYKVPTLRFLFHPQRRQRRADRLVDRVRRRRPVDPIEQAALLVVGDQRLGLVVVAIEAVADDLRLVVVADHERFAADVAGPLALGRV